MTDNNENTTGNTAGLVIGIGCGAVAIGFVCYLVFDLLVKSDSNVQFVWLLTFIFFVPVLTGVGLGLYYAFRMKDSRKL
jgi:hypothetical protein